MRDSVLPIRSVEALDLEAGTPYLELHKSAEPVDDTPDREREVGMSLLLLHMECSAKLKAAPPVFGRTIVDRASSGACERGSGRSLRR